MPDHPFVSSSDGGTSSQGSFAGKCKYWLRNLGRKRNGGASLRESLEEVIEEHEADVQPLVAEERVMLMNLLDFGEQKVGDVAVPLADIKAVEISISMEELARVFSQIMHSRLPVYRDTLDDPVGMIHIKDVLAAISSGRKTELRDMIREVLFVPPSMPVLQLLIKMRMTRIHMALVVDEYGGTDGLATIEDLIEEIVGEIEDEHDEIEGPLVTRQRDGSFEADARVRIEVLEELLKLDLLPEDRDEDVDTLGGLVVSIAGRVPAKGELIDHPAGLEIEVVDADLRRVKWLKIRRLKRDDPDATPGRADPPSSGAD
ncbi:MAG: HlyC/CorC family transporter [Rhodospirillales bacterium]|nr:HlyC/CorC family transporter [Rhodospirillales bacterium]